MNKININAKKMKMNAITVPYVLNFLLPLSLFSILTFFDLCKEVSKGQTFKMKNPAARQADRQFEFSI